MADQVGNAGKAIRWVTGAPGMPRRSEPGQCAACSAASVAWRTERTSVAAGAANCNPRVGSQGGTIWGAGSYPNSRPWRRSSASASVPAPVRHDKCAVAHRSASVPGSISESDSGASTSRCALTTEGEAMNCNVSKASKCTALAFRDGPWHEPRLTFVQGLSEHPASRNAAHPVAATAASWPPHPRSRAAAGLPTPSRVAGMVGRDLLHLRIKVETP